MVFNWFRRQYSESGSSEKETPPQSTQDESATSAPAGSPTDAATDQSSPAAAEDYLNWAKAAYKNIQKQQKPETEVAETEVAEVAAETEVAEVAAETEVAEVAEVAEVEPAETVAEVPEVAPEAIVEATDAAQNAGFADTDPQIAGAIDLAPVAPQLEVTAENIEIAQPATSVVEETESIASEAQADESLPFWARAQAERMDRIERLKETAIEEPEVIAAAAERAAIIEEIPGFDFDEGFLWSSEILASQGRRPDQVSVEEISWLQKLRKGLERTRRSLINRLKAIVGQGPLNQDAVAEIETLLLQADVGVAATDIIISRLQERLKQEALPPEQALAFLKTILRDILDAPTAETAAGNPAYSLTFAPEKDTFNIWLIVGVNGAGKTTTIGKLAHIAQKSGYNTLIAAADTFRAAAVEQVKVWGARSGVEIIANPGKNTDPAAVVFDAIAAANARNTELLIVDTAGRLQNKKNLMDELSKIRRIVDKKAPGATVESLLVLDATLGQNGLRQAEVFAESAKLSGVVLTKLDGSAKGGVALAVVQQLGLPIRFIGVGESIEDLRPFSSYEFVEALLDFRF
ncbi:signal recognition particle-docking protein FtsY [Tychonema sp. LEGE 07199]|uniref:signal recognition particle-docking protein FtsY n=1 Tax=unclassified Tychonema TaxID=2642144 RepID=UPI001880F2F2|nr:MULTISPECIES: signal recognition particle-docking protein FtsY [unclassified Tychonema]MBE9122067.1 signal recognition particle-docking protein FtsY [Tychonema sp. LEGE 07199]MBE9134281.1 signal recognition particle-docking protein FtsY [Tychonema sp. LEGE 07196]